jgi:hypothetical protein
MTFPTAESRGPLPTERQPTPGRVSRRNVVAAAAFASGLLLAATAPAATAAKAPVSQLRDVELPLPAVVAAGTQPGTAAEPHVAANPDDPSHAVVVSQLLRADDGGAGAIAVSVTRDAGRTWRSSPLPRLSRATGGSWPRVSDPVVAFGPAGVVHVSTLGVDVTAPTVATAILHHVSRDGGRTWEGPFEVVAARGAAAPLVTGVDKNWLAVDRGTGAGHRPGRVYVTWTQLTSAKVAYSDDDGRTWSEPALVHVDGFVTTPVVTADGDLAVSAFAVSGGVPARPDGAAEAASSPSSMRVVMAVARGAGSVSNGQPLVFTPSVVGTYSQGSPGGQRAGGTVTLVADPAGPNLHALWEDNRFGSGSTDVVISSSSDRGSTWTAPRLLRPAPAEATERWAPAGWVARDGSVHVTFRTWARDGEPVDTAHVVSRDHGRTFSRPVEVNRSVRTDLSRAATAGGQAFLGDYHGTDGSGRLVYVARVEAAGPGDDRRQRTWVAVLQDRGSARS